MRALALLLSLCLLWPALGWGATYYLSDADITAQTLETLATSAPSSLEETQGWVVNQKYAPYYCGYMPDIVLPRTSSQWSRNELSSFTERGYRTAATLNGSFANANWVLSYKVKSNAYYAQTGYVRFRLWRSTNAAGSGATQITPGWQSSSLIAFTGANQYQTGQITWTPGAGVTLSNEYLFLEISWSCGASGANNAATVYWCHNEGSAEKLETPAFSNVSMSMAGTLGAVTSAITAAEVANNSMVATLGAVTADMTMEIEPNPMSMDATLADLTAAANAAYVVRMAGDQATFDMGAFEREVPIPVELDAITANIGMWFPMEVVQFDIAATLGAITSEITANEGAAMSLSNVPVVSATTDMGAFETWEMDPLTMTADINMTTDFSTVSMSAAATLAQLTSEMYLSEGASLSAAASLGAVTGNIIAAELVSNSMVATLKQMSAVIEMQNPADPEPGLSEFFREVMGLTQKPAGGYRPKKTE